MSRACVLLLCHGSNSNMIFHTLGYIVLLLEYLLKCVVIMCSLCGCSLTAADCEALAKMLSGGSRLRVLSLYGNKLEDQGLIHLSSALENCRLEEIKYSCILRLSCLEAEM